MRMTKKIQRRKDATKEKLQERYLGKKALSDTWMQVKEGHNDYTRDLKKRVDGHKNDLIYRGYL